MRFGAGYYKIRSDKDAETRKIEDTQNVKDD